MISKHVWQLRIAEYVSVPFCLFYFCSFLWFLDCCACETMRKAYITYFPFCFYIVNCNPILFFLQAMFLFSASEYRAPVEKRKGNVTNVPHAYCMLEHTGSPEKQSRKTENRHVKNVLLGHNDKNCCHKTILRIFYVSCAPSVFIIAI